MAENNPELQSKLYDLDKELAEGDITQKGYEKRRTLLLSNYLGGAQALRPVSQHDQYSSSHGSHSRQPSISASINSQGPPSQVARFAETQLGVRNPSLTHSFSSGGLLQASEGTGSSQDGSRSHTMSRSDYAFNPAEHQFQDTPTPAPVIHDGQQQQQQSRDDRTSTMLDGGQGYFSDFTSQAMHESRDSYGGPQRYSTGEALSPTAFAPRLSSDENSISPAGITHLLPLEPRGIPFNIVDPHNNSIQMSRFDSLGAVLRHRGKAQAKQPAMWVLDQKGKETASITWDKFASKAEKVAQVIRDKSNLYRGDRVALIYRDTEVIDFAIALMGCFIAGVVAVPINFVDDYQRLTLLLQTTQAHLALTTDNNLKTFARDIQQNKLRWPTGVEWWKTNEFGSYHAKKNQEAPPPQVPDLAYIEFSRAPTGDLRGVVLSHRTVMHQMASLSSVITSIPETRKDQFAGGLRDKNGNLLRTSRSETILSYLDPRHGIGMITNILWAVYGGHTTVWMEQTTPETAGLYAHLITKYRATVLVADYSRLKFAAYNYQQDPMTTRQYKKGMEPNFSSVKICLIDALAVDCEFHEILADRWFKPMRNDRAREVVAPVLCLPEHGGMMISMRDWLGGEERMGCALTLEEQTQGFVAGDNDPSSENGSTYQNLVGGNRKSSKSAGESASELSEVLIDKEALKTNEVIVLATGEEARRRSHEAGTVRVGAFGYPIPDATVSIVDPETGFLCQPFQIGEIWVDSPSLSGGFWSLPKHTETVFHARPYRFNPSPQLLDMEFLRTGLLGFVIAGKIYVLGLYEDRIRQKVEWSEHGVVDAEHRYFFVQHLVSSVMKNIPKIHDCSGFDVHVNGEFLPVMLIETLAASTAPLVPGGPPRQLDPLLLDSLSERVMEVLYNDHHLRTYCVMIYAPNTLPKVIRNGRSELGNMLCRREFDNGNLPCVHVQFGVERAVQNISFGDDPAGGIFSSVAVAARDQMLFMNEKQYSGVDYREVVVDDRTSTPLNQFSNIEDLLQWRVTRQSEELSFCTIDSKSKEGKGLSWKKLDLKIAAVAMYLRNKAKVQQGDHVLLMYTHSEDFVYAVHACFVLGAVAIPMAPVDPARLSEDAPALLSMIADFRIKAICVNAEVDSLLKQKTVSQHLRQSAMILKVNIPPTYNTSKPPKQSHGCRDLGLTVKPAFVQPGFPVLIWVYWTPDQRRTAVQLGHKTIMALCKVQKETCQMTSTRPVIACVRSTVGLGFIHMCLMGIYLATPTYLISPVDFGQNPASLFLTLSRYKIKDTYATSQMLDYSMVNVPNKGFALQELKNLMISTESRPRVDLYQRVRVHFAQSGLDRTSINTIYSHVMNPMVASRSYMCIEPIELWLDPQALRRGLVVPIDPEKEPYALLIQDSGMVPVSTQIAIVNPETNLLCKNGEYGEIWVQSEACGHSFYLSTDPLDAERFNGHTMDGDPSVRYVRTGDLGFLWNVSRAIGPGGAQVEMQILFVLGSIGETFDVNGLSHFPMDIESSVEKCHRHIAPNGCAVFQAGGLVVVLIEVLRKPFLASLVPVIVSAILNGHQFVVDIVAFVARNDFPRSRLGEKQRGKILASWVTRKLRTIAQFNIRDVNGMTTGSVSGGRASTMQANSLLSFRNSSLRGGITGPGSSLKHVESSSGLADLHEGVVAEDTYRDYAPLPEGISEMPASYANSMQASPPIGGHDTIDMNEHVVVEKATDTPTEGEYSEFRQQPLHLNTTLDYSPAEMPADDYLGVHKHATSELPATKVTTPGGASIPITGSDEARSPYLDLPSVDGRGSLMPEGLHFDNRSRSRSSHRSNGGGGGGLRVMNHDASSSDDDDESSSHQGYDQGATMYMNLGQRG